MKSTVTIASSALRAGVTFGVFAGVVLGLAGGWRVGILYGMVAAGFFAGSLSGLLLWVMWRKRAAGVVGRTFT